MFTDLDDKVIDIDPGEMPKVAPNKDAAILLSPGGQEVNQLANSRENYIFP